MAANLILYYATISGLGEGKAEKHHEEHAAHPAEKEKVTESSEPKTVVHKEEPVKKASESTEEPEFDPFAEVGEEEAANEAARKEAKVKEKEDKERKEKEEKDKKPVPVQRSNFVLDVKPCEWPADMATMEAKVRAIQMDGLVWGPSKFVVMAYEVQKLQISAVVEDEKVSQEDLEERIMAFEDIVQSVNVAARVRV